MYGYERFLELRGQLSAIMRTVGDAYRTLNAEDRTRHLDEARRALESDAFRLMVVGEFKRGKSTVINAMLGQSVLPAKVAPCTGVITEVKWGEAPKAILHPTNSEQRPFTIPVDRIRDYVQIREEDDPLAAPSPYNRLEVFHPLPLLRNNVEIIDSPGLNENQSRTEIALGYLPRADAVILVLSCDQQLSQSELGFIDQHLSGRGLRHVFFLWNRYDYVAGNTEDIEDLQRRSRRHLEPRIGTGERIFYLSARDGLRARQANRAEDLERSGLASFERALEQFLTTERGRVKLLMPLRVAELAVRDALAQHIPRQLSMLAQPIEELRARYEAQRPRLDEVHRQRESLLRSVDRRQKALEHEAIAAYQNLVAQLCAELPEAARGVEINLFQTLLSSREAQKKLITHLQSWLEGRILSWQQQTLGPLVDRHMDELQADLNEKLGKFLRDLDAIREALSPDVRVEMPAGEDPTPLNRVLSAVGGFVFGGLGAAMEGAAGGYEQLLRGLGLHIALGIGMVIAGFSMPVVVGALLLLGAIRTLWEGSAATDRLRQRVTDEVATLLRQKIPEVSISLSESIEGQFSKVRQSLDDGMRLMVAEVEGNIREILDEKRRTEAMVAAKQGELALLRERLLELSGQLEQLRTVVDG